MKHCSFGVLNAANQLLLLLDTALGVAVTVVHTAGISQQADTLIASIISMA